MSAPAPVMVYLPLTYVALPTSAGVPTSAVDHPDGSACALARQGTSRSSSASDAKRAHEYLSVRRQIKIRPSPLEQSYAVRRVSADWKNCERLVMRTNPQSRCHV